MDRDGFISNGELYLVLKQMVGNNLKVCLAAFSTEQALMNRTSSCSRLSTRRSWRLIRMGELMVLDGDLS